MEEEITTDTLDEIEAYARKGWKECCATREGAGSDERITLERILGLVRDKRRQAQATNVVDTVMRGALDELGSLNQGETSTRREVAAARLLRDYIEGRS